MATETALRPAAARAATHAYRPQLDGLRAVAVAAVAWSHWERPYQFGLPFGAGVHLFFVLSGFLITRILLDVRESSDRTEAVRAFYVRRALRIVPAFYLTLALAWLANVPPIRESLAWHATYLSNVFVFASGEWPGSISHLWSLAVEEQFYLVWPWVIVFLPRRWIVPAVVAAIAGAPLFRWWLAADGYRESMLAVLTPGCLDSLGVGALCAMLGASAASPVRGRSTVIRNIVSCAFASYVLLLWAAAIGTTLPAGVVALKQTLQAVVFGWIVVRAAEGFGGVAGRVLSAAPVVYVGRISYGVYLSHGFAGDLLAGAGIVSREVPEPLRFVLLASVTLATAALSFRLIEAPLIGLKRAFPYQRVSAVPRAAPASRAGRSCPVPR